MPKVLVTERYLENIADSIRDKLGTADDLSPGEMAGAIDEITVSADGVTLLQLTASENGTYIAPEDTAYSKVTVAVPANTGDGLIVEKYEEDYARGYVNSGKYFTGDSTTRMDIYAVLADHQYLIMLGETVSNRFRCMFTPADVTAASADVTGIQIGTDTDDTVYPYTIKGTGSDVSRIVPFSPSEDGFIIIGKTNLGIDGLESYVLDVTDIDSAEVPSAAGERF